MLKILLTVFLAYKKEIFHEKSYLHILTRPLGQNLTLILKLVSKSSIKYKKVSIFVVGVSGEMDMQILKLYCKRWAKF